jgi:hypothetical protein
VGNFDLANLPRGQFNTLTYDIPAAILSKLLQKKPNDCKVTLLFNLAPGSQTWAVDRLRFR